MGRRQHPPPPDAFPPGWDEANGVTLKPAAVTEPLKSASPPTPSSPIPPRAESPTSPAPPPPQVSPNLAAIDTKPADVEPADTELADAVAPAVPGRNVLRPIVPPLPTAGGDDIHIVTVILRPIADKARDKLLLKRIFGTMISCPGNDRFAFHIFEKGRGHLLEFPNLTTGISPELVSQLNELVGSTNVRVEPVGF